MITEIDLLPLPEASKMYDIPGYDEEEMKDYARANVARNTALLRAEIDALRAGAEQHLRQAMSNGAKARAAYAEIEKLRRELEEWKSLAEAQVELRDEAEDHAEDLAKSLAELITWIPSADTYRRLGFDPEAPMRALKRAKLSLGGVRSA